MEDKDEQVREDIEKYLKSLDLGKRKNNLSLHFKYVSIILVMVIIAITSIAVAQNTKAWLFIGYAGTVLSVVLSVIAIFITFIDIAGQEKKLSEITKTSNELKFTLNQFISESQKFYERMQFDSVRKNLSNDDSITDESEETQDTKKEEISKDSMPWASEPVGLTGVMKLKKYEISENDIRAAAEVSGVNVRRIDSSSLYIYTVHYYANLENGADFDKFKRLISIKAEILD